MYVGLTLAGLAILGFSPAHAFFDFEGWEKKYNELLAEYTEVKKEIESLKKQYQDSQNEIDSLNRDIRNLKAESAHWENQTQHYYGMATEKTTSIMI